MTQISSESTHSTTTLNDEVTLVLRAIAGKRTVTIGYLLDKSRQRHITDNFAHEAMRHYGRGIGHKLHAQTHDRQDLQEFAGLFTHGLKSQVYKVGPVSASWVEFIVLSHYCLYVNCWRQQGRDTNEIEMLCDIYVESDHALTDAFPGLRLEVQTALTHGDAACRLRSYHPESHETG